MSEKEKHHVIKIETFQKFDIVGSYFPVKFYDNMNYNNKILVYKELKSMWIAFCQDNKLIEKNIYNKEIFWESNLNKKNIENILLDKINFLLNHDIEYNLKKMITYLIIGAFAYIDADIKNIYNNFDFI